MAANLIGLVIHTQRDEIAILLLVGGTPNFIAAPYVLQGGLWGLLAALEHQCEPLLQQAASALGGGFEVHLFEPRLGMGIMMAGLLVGVVGSFAAVQRFLRRGRGSFLKPAAWLLGCLLLAPPAAAAATSGVFDELQRLEQALRRSQATLDANDSEYGGLGRALGDTQRSRQAAHAEQHRLQQIQAAAAWAARWDKALDRQRRAAPPVAPGGGGRPRSGLTNKGNSNKG